MFTASFYFLGFAVSIFAALVCLSTGKHAGKHADVDLDTLHAVSVCVPTGRPTAADATTAAMYRELAWHEKARLSDMRSLWKRWYDRCRTEARLKQKAMYSWARTSALCAVLCLGGVLLEAEFDQPITISSILAGFRRPYPAASALPTSQTPPSRSTSPPATLRSPQK
jgi:hypothetical protein